jgi:hypothetical protein
MDEGEYIVVDVVQGAGTSILLTQQGIWIPKPRSSEMKDVPDLTQTMLGSALDKRKIQEGYSQKIDMEEIITQSEEIWDLERKLRSLASNIPYTSIIRCYLRRPGRFKRTKFAFDYFDEKSLSIVTCEFRVTPEGVERLEETLSGLIPDRLEVH